MSYKAEIELSLHLLNFKNVQIDRQGYLCLSAQLFSKEASNNTNIGLPYNILPFYKTNKSTVGPAIIEDTVCKSSIIRIQYADQKYALNDVIQFKISVESLPISASKLFLNLSILFCPLHSYTTFLNQSHIQQTMTLALCNIQQGIFHYYSLQFTQVYASKVDLLIFGMITNYKLFPFHIDQEQQTNSKKDKEREKVCNVEQLFLWTGKYIQGCIQPAKYFYTNFAKKLRYFSFLLKQKVYSNYKNKKTVQLKLPKFIKTNQNISKKQFYDFFSNFNPIEINVKIFNQEIHQLHQDNYFFAQQIALAMSKGLLDIKQLEVQFKKYMFSQKQSRIVRQICYGNISDQGLSATQSINMARKIRKQKREQDSYPITETNERDEEYLFYQINCSSDLEGKPIQSIKNNFQFKYDERNMLVFICHGFQASSFDMRIIQRGFKQALPLAEVVISCTNQIDTDCDIDFMGKKLAKEVVNKIKNQDFNNKEVILNFVGHSMGGIIARAALRHLGQYQNQLGFFCSLSSPHLGYRNGTDNMIKAGLWVMRKMMKQSTSLDQLSMNDNSNPAQTFLFHLSSEGSLKNFKKIILISSAEDSYVPWHSARISSHSKGKSGSKLQNQMIKNILGNLTVHRIDVNFACEKNDLDGIIGRKAHINFLINRSLFGLINSTIPKIFDLRQL